MALTASERGEALEELRGIVTRFREAYWDACTAATASEAEAIPWDHVWQGVVERAAGDLLRPGCDRYAVRRRVERMVDLFRRHTCDPVRLYASLEVQRVVVGHVAALERWCDEHPPRPATTPVVTPAAAASPAWRAMLRHADLFEGWRFDGGNAHDARWVWRPPHNLYATRHAAHDPAACEGGACAADARLALLLGALGETMRRGRGASDPAGAAADADADPDEWAAYEAETAARYGEWVDVDGVAVRTCGYPADPDRADGETRAEWRAPIRAAEADLARLALGPAAPPFAAPVLRRWLRGGCGCGDAHLGVRWPPAFTALIADLFVERVLEQRRVPRWDPVVIERAVADGDPHPLQTYTVWLRCGLPGAPDADDLTLHWDTADRLALEAAGGVLTRGLVARWRANRPADAPDA